MLHRSAEPTGDQSLSDVLALAAGDEACATNPPVHTLDWEIRNEMKRVRGGEIPSIIYDIARRHARAARKLDPNPRVCAAFAAERACYELSLSQPFQRACPDAFIAGVPYVSQQDLLTGVQVHREWDASVGPDDDAPPCPWPGIAPADLAAIRRLAVPWDDVRRNFTFPAVWTPTAPTTIWLGDSMRPPVEALLVAADVIRGDLFYDPSGWMLREGVLALDPFKRPTIVAIGLGYAAGAQALSAMLPLGRVIHEAFPYERQRSPLGPAQATILGIPSLHAIAVAEVLGEHREVTYLKRRDLVQGVGIPKWFVEHVPETLGLAARYRHVGRPLVLVADPEPHAEAIRLLREQQAVVPLEHEGVSTASRGIWVDYVEPQWAPHGLPPSSGKVVSFWRWA